MPVYRFLLQGALESGRYLRLSGPENEHLVKVLRRNVGEYVEVVNGEGGLGKGVLVEKSNKSSTIRLETVEEHPRRPPSTVLSLAFPALKQNSQIENIVLMATEVGVDRFIVYPPALSSAPAGRRLRMNRLASHAAAATKQSGRLFLPSISEAPPLTRWGPHEWSGHSVFLCDTGASLEPLQASIASQPRGDDVGVLVVVGPEMGFSLAERQAILDTGPGRAVSLGSSILRAETAAVTAAVLSRSSMDQRHT